MNGDPTRVTAAATAAVGSPARARAAFAASAAPTLFAALASLAALALLAAGCPAGLSVRASLDSMRIVKMDSTAVTIETDLKIKNPSSEGFAVERYEAVVSVDKVEVARLSIPARGAVVSPRGELSVRVPIRLELRSIYGKVSDAGSRKEIPLWVELSAIAGSVRATVAGEGVMPIPKEPEAKLEGIRLDGIVMGKPRLVIDVRVTSPLAFPARVEHLKITMDLLGVRVADHALSLEHPTIDPGGDYTLRTEIPIRLESHPRLADHFKKAESRIEFNATGEVALATPYGPVVHEFRFEGTIELYR